MIPVYGFPEECKSGKPGRNVRENYRRAAKCVVKILKGTRAGNLPIEQPMKFELVLNMKTAKALKLEISRELELRVDGVIE